MRHINASFLWCIVLTSAESILTTLDSSMPKCYGKVPEIPIASVFELDVSQLFHILNSGTNDLFPWVQKRPENAISSRFEFP